MSLICLRIFPFKVERCAAILSKKFASRESWTSNHQMIEKGSLKLRLMSEKTKDDVKWKDELCAKHEKEMIELLCNACGEELSQIWYNDCAKI